MQITQAAHDELKTRLLVLVGELAPASDKARAETSVLDILGRCAVVDVSELEDLLTAAVAEAAGLQLQVDEQRAVNDTLSADVARLIDINTRVTGELEQLHTRVRELETTISDLRAAQPPLQADTRPGGDSTA